MKERIDIIKIGGNVIDDSKELNAFLESFAKLEGKKILVHGGGKEATRLSTVLGVETVKIDGRRVTTRKTLDIVTMVYAGLLNKNIVAALQSYGCNSIGLSGADARVIPAHRRPAEPIDFGYVGDINPEDISADFINLMLDNGIAPVFCAICFSEDGSLLNCNADSIAGALAVALSKSSPVRLTYCFEKPGVLENVEDDSSVIGEITPFSFERLKAEGIVAEGMIPKLTNALESAKKGVEEIRICSARNVADPNCGTLIHL